jgi:hypothetical protein
LKWEAIEKTSQGPWLILEKPAFFIGSNFSFVGLLASAKALPLVLCDVYFNGMNVHLFQTKKRKEKKS